MEREQGNPEEERAKPENSESSEDAGSNAPGETAEGTNELHPVIFPGIEQPKKLEFKTQDEKDAGLKQAEEKYTEGCALNKEGKLPEAIDTLYEALEIRLAILGERSPLCGKLYQKLGDVLLALGRERGNDFSSALIKKRLKEKMTGDQPKPQNKPNSKIDVSDSEDESDENEEEDPATAGQGEDYLDESWKMLESARVIYSEHQQTHMLELSDVYQSLGDLALELELKPEETLKEYTQCLRLRDAMPADTKGRDRLLAEAHFSLALAQQYHADNANAKENFRSALMYLQKRLSQIRSSAPSSSSSSGSGMTRGDEKPQQKSPEEEELLAIIDDVQQKLDEVSDVAGQEAAKNALMSVLKPQAVEHLQQQHTAPAALTFAKLLQPSSSAASSTLNLSVSSTGTLQSGNGTAAPANGSAPAAPVHVLGTFGRKRKPPTDDTTAPTSSAPSTTTSDTTTQQQPAEKKEKTDRL